MILNDLKRVTKELMGNKNQENNDEKVINHFIEKPAIFHKSKLKKNEQSFLTLQEQEKILIEKALKDTKEEEKMPLKN